MLARDMKGCAVWQKFPPRYWYVTVKLYYGTYQNIVTPEYTVFWTSAFHWVFLGSP